VLQVSTRSDGGVAHSIFGFRQSVWTRLPFVAARVACFLLTSRGVTCLHRRPSAPPPKSVRKNR
jgi:hypothetical protein